MEIKTSSIKPVKFSIFLNGLLAFLVITAFSAFAQPATGLLQETWNGIPGTAVADLIGNPAYPNSPSTRAYTTLFEIPTNVADNYGTRVRGYVTPPTTGNYTFWISGNDNCDLWLSTDANPANTRRIAFVPVYTSPRQWTKYPEQQSVVIALTGGQRYFIESRHKTAVGGDHLAVGWQGPGITGEMERPIPASRLAPWLLSTGPVITTQPANRTVNQGQTAAFSVVATGSGLSYQWRKDNSNIIGAIAATYTTPATLPSDNGTQYSVIVSNAAGTVTSANAILTVISPPAITTQPANQTVSLGQSATFTVAFTGTSPTFQWRKNAVNISGATSPSYTTPATVGSDNGAQFSVVLTNAAGTVTSANASLTVTSAPVIITQPTNRTVNLGQSAAFSVVASGTALTYQWRKNGVNIPGATIANYTTPPTVSNDSGASFSVVVSNATGSVLSNPAILTIRIPPSIITQPASITVGLNQTALFEVVAAGTAPLTYQWRKNGVNIPGATLSSFLTAPAALVDNGSQYSVVITNAAGSVTSANALLTVLVVVPNNKKIAISGALYDNAGNPLGYPVPVNVDATVSLMNAQTGGSAVYTENFLAANGKAIRVENSLFVARLGEGVTSQNLQQVITSNILVPRTPLTAAAYSLGGTSTLGLSGKEMHGAGDPNLLEVQAAVGVIYVNSLDNSTWFKLSNGWKLMD
jgi:PA14 domain